MSKGAVSKIITAVLSVLLAVSAGTIADIAKKRHDQNKETTIVVDVQNKPNQKTKVEVNIKDSPDVEETKPVEEEKEPEKELIVQERTYVPEARPKPTRPSRSWIIEITRGDGTVVRKRISDD